jgi:hypothetical protein
VTWKQDKAPTPINYITGQYTLVPIYDFQSTGANVLSGWTDMAYFNIPSGGGLETPGGNPPMNPFYTFDPNPVSQQYETTSTEANPIFIAGNYTGVEFFSQDSASLIFAAIGAPGPVPGAGLAGLAALALAGFYARTRRA